MMTNKFKIGDLKRAEYNPRFMPDGEMQALKKSIEQWGIVEPIVVNIHKDRYGVLVGGHQRVTAIEQLIARGIHPRGIEQTPEGGFYVPVVTVELPIEEEKLLNVALNRIKGKWDEDKLYELILGVKENPLIPATGFAEDEISRILDQGIDMDPEEESISLPLEPISKPGEVYNLGLHRLICGDSTDPLTYEKLLEAEKADMIWSDPPYNVAYKSRGGGLADQGKESIKNDDLSAPAFKELIDKSFQSMLTYAKTGAAFYLCSGWSSYPQFLDSLLKNGFKHSGVIVWIKNVPSMGWNDYRYKHEWIAKAKKVDAKTAESIIYGWKEGTHQFQGSGEFDVWEMPRKSVLHYLHPTEKPDWLPMRAIRNSSKRGDIVLDPFAGSGSVMAAAEKTGRRAFMIELDPKFCDVIRKRWEKIENKKVDTQDEKK